MNNLDRFIEAQESDYNIALSEIKDGRKRSHWIWYIFPQLSSLGHSMTAKYYGIKDEKEAKDYINNQYLKNHLVEISNELLKLSNNDISDIMGYPDDLKLRSCMTLFDYVSNEEVFQKVLDKYYDGKKDELTLKILKEK